MGQILAPITNKRDAKRLRAHFNKNTGPNCPITSENLDEYHIGLDITDTDQGLKKVFSNGKKWNSKKHNKFYDDMTPDYYDNVTENCTIAMYTPNFVENQLYYARESDDCTPLRARYICLKPARKASAKSLVQENNNQGYENLAVSNVTLFTVFMALFCALSAVHYRKQAKKFENECKCLKKEKNVVTKIKNKNTSCVSIETDKK